MDNPLDNFLVVGSTCLLSFVRPKFVMSTSGFYNEKSMLLSCYFHRPGLETLGTLLECHLDC